MLEIFEIAALLLILANLFLILVLFFLFFRAFFKFIGEDTLNTWNLDNFVPHLPTPERNPPKGAGFSTNTSMTYTPTEEVPQGEVPLDQFVPDFSKEIKIKYEDVEEDHGMSVEEEETK